jgi:Kef-type K+ transport system membrane component KefB
MTTFTDAGPLLIVMLLAVLAPVVSSLSREIKLPFVVVEILLGILAGPHVLNLVSVTPSLAELSRFGMAFLFFWIGYEIDFKRLWGKDLIRAGKAWGISLVLGVSIGFILKQLDVVNSALLFGLATTTSALGIIVPILRDREDMDSPFARAAVAMATVGELAPILIASIIVIDLGNPKPIDIILLVSLVAGVIAATYLATRMTPPAFVTYLRAQIQTTAQLPIRLASLLLASLFFLTGSFGLDAILGALSAGIILGLLTDNETGDEIKRRFESIGFGLFIPIFFITTGIRFDLGGIASSTTALIQIPFFLAILLITRGAPTLLYKDEFNAEERQTLAFSSATALPVLIALTDIGISTGIMRTEVAASLVGAGVLSVLIYPALMLRTRSHHSA